MEACSALADCKQHFARRVHHDLRGQSVAILPLPIEQRQTHGHLLVGGNRIERARRIHQHGAHRASGWRPCAAASCRACGGPHRRVTDGWNGLMSRRRAPDSLRPGKPRHSPEYMCPATGREPPRDPAAIIRIACVQAVLHGFDHAAIHFGRVGHDRAARTAPAEQPQRFSLSRTPRCWPLRTAPFVFVIFSALLEQSPDPLCAAFRNGSR